MKKHITFRMGEDFASFLIDRKALFTFVSLLAVVIVIFFTSAGMGEMKIAPWAVFQALIGQGSETDSLIVMSFRMPRILIALLVGMALAVAGSILQGLIRNPLASPEVLGVTGGAGVAVVLFLGLFSDRSGALTISVHWLPLGAFAGATITALLLYMLSFKNGEVPPLRMVLVGIGISALAKALTTLFMILGPIHQASQANIWLTGTVYGSNWKNVVILAPWTLVLIVITLLLARKLNVQELGDELAVGLGSEVQRQRLVLLLICTALIGGAVAFSGAIGFVGLMAPHIARRLVGSAFGALIPVSALVGAILVLTADLIGRMAFSPLEIPAGVFTAAIGAPYFVYLLYKSRNA
ncbi:iron ABC transporter permease [Ectobacillus sp. JY-23]|uniref:FecCD family ABC transporter permease n=1 Tax=Ectobacillus sp. JY-23 TaxID=2933872 RepID=UPI001FF1FA72|nr:iron ABC transporter permease [Ectobacillus sp. JY-23]UOY91934.1 iron ABC transporter permease [Ectobacillus sp. JY-23]